MKKRFSILTALILVLSLLFSGCSLLEDLLPTEQDTPSAPSVTLDSIPAFDGSTPYVIINDNVPFFENEDTSKSYEIYSPLDSHGRCGVALSCIGIDLMPNEDRGSIGQVKPSGWHTVKYDIVDGKYLYNRCHLIGFQLTAENANEKNLITGTRYMNVTGMLPFENMTADYIKENPENHVLYRVTPIFDGNNLVASGVLMEAKSVEDNGEGLLFCVYVYNSQPGITINYLSGVSYLTSDITGQLPEETPDSPTDVEIPEEENKTYILNTNSQKFHKESCSGAQSKAEKNKQIYYGKHTDLVLDGYSPCGICKP